MASGNQIGFRDPNIELQLVKRTSADSSVGLVAKRDLERWYWLLQQAQRKLKLTPDEFDLVCAALSAGEFPQAWTVSSIPDDIATAIKKNKLDKTYKVDRDVIVDKLQRMSDLELLALLDRVEQVQVQS